MMRVPNPGRGLVRCLGLAAAAILVLSAATSERAEAVSLINPAAAPAAKHVSGAMTTEVRGHGGGGYHGGGGGAVHAFHSSGHVGGTVFHGGAYRSAPVFHGGGYRTAHVFHGGGFRHGGFAFRHHHFHRHFYAPYYYDYPYYYHRCRVIWTYYGPRKVCHYRHHYWRHHHRHHRHHIYW